MFFKRPISAARIIGLCLLLLLLVITFAWFFGNRDNENSPSGRLIYTCNCGWIDTGHAKPEGALGLWAQVFNETGKISKDKKGYQVIYAQQNIAYGIPVGVSEKYYVKKGLSVAQKEQVALAIFMEVSYGFENFQWRYGRLATNSGFSAEDLVSDLLGFYKAVRPGIDQKALCKPISKAGAEKVWEEAGATGHNKNHSFSAYLYPCVECGRDTAATVALPLEFRSIQPAQSGALFRKWNDD